MFATLSEKILKAQAGYMKKLTKCLQFIFFLQCHQLSSTNLKLHLVCLIIIHLRKRKPEPDLLIPLCTVCLHHPQIDNCSITITLWDKPERQWWMKLFTVGKTLGKYTYVLFEGEINRCIFVHWFMEFSHWIDQKLRKFLMPLIQQTKKGMMVLEGMIDGD